MKTVLILSLGITAVSCSLRMCADPGLYSLLKHNTTLVPGVTSVTHASGILLCVKNCVKEPLCYATSYNLVTSECLLGVVCLDSGHQIWQAHDMVLSATLQDWIEMLPGLPNITRVCEGKGLTSTPQVSETTTPTKPETGCTSGIRRVAFRKHVFGACRDPVTWAVAKRTCACSDGRLLEPTKQIFFNAMAALYNLRLKADVWLGLRYDPSTDQVRWTSGRAMQYNQPEIAQIAKEFRKRRSDSLCCKQSLRGQWSLVPCSSRHIVLCEYPDNTAGGSNISEYQNNTTC